MTDYTLITDEVRFFEVSLVKERDLVDPLCKVYVSTEKTPEEETYMKEFLNKWKGQCSQKQSKKQ